MRKQEFNSKLISLLPLDEVPVHVPLRRPRPSRFERLPVPVWNPYSRGRLGPAKSEPKALEQVADRIVSGKPPHAQHLLQSRVGTQHSRVRKPRRAPASTDSKNAVKVCTGSILLAENSAETADPGQPLPDANPPGLPQFHFPPAPKRGNLRVHCFVLLGVSLIQLKPNRVAAKQCCLNSEFRRGLSTPPANIESFPRRG